jgi:magnesium transporter
MPNNIKKSEKNGMLPGSLIYVGDEQAKETQISLIGYDEQNVTTMDIKTVDEAIAQKDQFSVLWMSINGLKDVKFISQVSSIYGLHPLTIEDILNTEQLPKFDVFDNYIFIIVRIYSYDHKINRLQSEQISLILGHNFVITFQEKPSSVFDYIKDRLKNSQCLMRRKEADYLLHALLDISVDTYYQVLESIGDAIEDLEEKTVTNTTPEIVKQIHVVRRSVIFLRKSVWPLREVISGLHHRVSPLIQDSTLLYLKDVYDHTVQVIDTVETYRDLLSGIMDIYISTINSRLNEVMKVLTVFSTIFIPLTFISSLYGMNFNTTISRFNMPELHWRYGYIMVLVVMFCVAITMLLFFRRRKWL